MSCGNYKGKAPLNLKVSTPSWSSQTLFIMAAVGSAVGLGNIWKFPYIAGEYGGGAFVLVYLACILLIGLPVLLSEIALGRAGHANPVKAMQNHAQETRSSFLWAGLGLNGVLAGVLILSFYSVIAGIALVYFVGSVQGMFIGIQPQQAQALFDAQVVSPWNLIFWHSVLMLLVALIISRGVRGGLEKAINFMMPGLFLILLVLLGYATTSGGFAQSWQFMFSADFSKLSWEAVLVALGHAFFTLSVGLGTMMAYGAYMGKDMSISRSGFWIVGMDTVIALLAGLVIFSIVFANALEPAAGPGLLFQTLPIAFGQMTGGWLFGSLFFLLVVMAALTSAISLLEPAVSWLEQSWQLTRVKAVILLGGLVWLLGIGTALSFNHWQDWYILGERHFFASLDFLTTNIMLPVGGLLIAVFVAWRMKWQTKQEQIDLSPALFKLFNFFLRYVTPLGILLVFAYNLSEDYMAVIFVMSIAVYVGYIYRVLSKRDKADTRG